MTFFCAGALMSALCAGFGGCSQSGEQEQKEDEVPAVIGTTPVPNEDIPSDVAAFFKEHLPSTDRSLLSPVEFSFGDIVDNEGLPRLVCLTINDMDEFEAIAPPDVELPDIDFGAYTLIIGQHRMGDPGYILEKQGIDTTSDVMTLNLVYKHLQGGSAQIITTFYYWGLYSKLPQKTINVEIYRQ